MRRLWVGRYQPEFPIGSPGEREVSDISDLTSKRGGSLHLLSHTRHNILCHRSHRDDTRKRRPTRTAASTSSTFLGKLSWCCALCSPGRSPVAIARQPVGTGTVQIRRSIVPNRRPVRGPS